MRAAKKAGPRRIQFGRLLDQSRHCSKPLLGKNSHDDWVSLPRETKYGGKYLLQTAQMEVMATEAVEQLKQLGALVAM